MSNQYDLYETVQKHDYRGKKFPFGPIGDLLVATNPDFEKGLASVESSPLLDWDLGVKKPGDVGMDIPIRIRGMHNVLNSEGKPYLQVYPEPPVHNYFVDFEEGWVDVPAGGYAELPSALHLKFPEDAWGMIRARSSTGWKRRLVAFEGTIDSGFTGMICCLVHNPNTYNVRLYHDDAVAQLVIIPKYPLKNIVQIDYDDLPKTDRSQTGFGSTGT